MGPIIRLATLDDLPAYHEHLRRHGTESGRDGDMIFAPYEEPWDRPFDALKKEKEERWSLPVTEVYLRFGLQEVGTNRDLFRVRGQKIDDTEMVLQLDHLSRSCVSEETES